MHYWLVKSEPDTWSWQQHQSKKIEKWDGVRNFQAANNLKNMQIGDLAYFYHSGAERQILGIVKVVKEYYPDPSDPKGRFGMVDFEALEGLLQPVTLQEIKAHRDLQHLALVRQSRLSVMPIDKKSWDLIYSLSQKT
jgi:predicted RNA-binding protein with PUA-like domain